MSEVTALGWSVTANLGGDRQIVFQSHVAFDATDAEINGQIDRVMRFTDRQKAVYEIIDYQKEIGDLRRDLALGEQNIADAEEAFRKAQAALDVQILEMGQAKTRIHNEAYAKAAASGQSTKAALRGKPTTDIERCEAGIKSAQEDKAKHETEREAALTNFQATQERRKTRVAELEKLIGEKQALIDGG